MQLTLCVTLLWSILASQCSAAVFGVPPPAPLKTLKDRQINVGVFQPPPTQDSFFTPPIGWQNRATGAVLKYRPNAYPSIYIGNCINTYQVMFRTTDSLGSATWSTTTVFIPASHANCNPFSRAACSHAMVTYTLPYDSCSQDATPSYLLQFGEPYGDMYDLLNAGYFVNAPDYEGYNSSYTAGVISGCTTLDATIAALSVAGNFGFDTANQKVALWGYSGGAFATQFAAELAEYYAPNLKLAGVVQGGNVPNLIAPATGAAFNNGDALTGLAIAGLIGITSQHPAARAYLNSKLKRSGPYNIVGWYNATTMSGYQLLFSYNNRTVGDYFVGGADALNNQILIDMYNTDSLMCQHGVPKMPMFVYKAINDEQATAYALDPYIDYYCQNGANVLYHRNTIGGHNQELFTGRLRVLDYLSDVLDGTNRISKPKTGCRTVNVTRAVSMTLQSTTAREGQLSYPYTAVVLTNIDVKAEGWTVYPNGSYTTRGGPLVNPNKRSESDSFTTILKRWKDSIVPTVLSDVRADISFLSAPQHRLDVVAESPYWSDRFRGILRKD